MHFYIHLELSNLVLTLVILLLENVKSSTEKVEFTTNNAGKY